MEFSSLIKLKLIEKVEKRVIKIETMASEVKLNTISITMNLFVWITLLGKPSKKQKFYTRNVKHFSLMKLSFVTGQFINVNLNFCEVRLLVFLFVWVSINE